MKFKVLIVITTIIFLFISCSPILPEPPDDPTPIPLPLPTATPVPEPISGTIFWDANGSGLMDETSFIVPDFDPSDPPYFFKLLAANDTGLGNLSPGELATVPEPPIPGIGVCLDEVCTETATGGSFTLHPEKTQNTYNLKFTDPNADDPAKTFRYINQWNGPVVIESYEINGVTVPEQHLNETSIFQISKQYEIGSGYQYIGFLQGFYTYPFVLKQYSKPFIWNYFDIIGNRLLNDRVNYDDTRDEIALNYNGELNKEGNPFSQIEGVSDSHTGLDFVIDLNKWILNAGTISINSYYHFTDDNETHVYLDNKDPYMSGRTGSTYAHLNKHLLSESIHQYYKGQIVALSGDSGDGNIYAGKPVPQLHFHIFTSSASGWKYFDPFRTTIKLDPLPENYWGSDYSYWTVDNIPQFPLAEIIE